MLAGDDCDEAWRCVAAASAADNAARLAPPAPQVATAPAPAPPPAACGNNTSAAAAGRGRSRATAAAAARSSASSSSSGDASKAARSAAARHCSGARPSRRVAAAAPAQSTPRTTKRTRQTRPAPRARPAPPAPQRPCCPLRWRREHRPGGAGRGRGIARRTQQRRRPPATRRRRSSAAWCAARGSRPSAKPCRLADEQLRAEAAVPRGSEGRVARPVERGQPRRVAAAGLARRTALGRRAGRAPVHDTKARALDSHRRAKKTRETRGRKPQRPNVVPGRPYQRLGSPSLAD